MTLPTPEVVEAYNRRWLAIHREYKPFVATVPLGSNPVWPLFTLNAAGRPVWELHEKYGHCPLPVSGVEWWGFQTKADRDCFVATYGATPED
jgi:hypothetical protein